MVVLVCDVVEAVVVLVVREVVIVKVVFLWVKGAHTQAKIRIRPASCRTPTLATVYTEH